MSTLVHPFCCLDYFLCKLSSVTSSSSILIGSFPGKFQREVGRKTTASVTAVMDPEAFADDLPLLLPVLHSPQPCLASLLGTVG